MRREGAPFRPLDHPRLVWRGATPAAPGFEDVYYSQDDGLAESRYTFLQGNDLPGRFGGHDRGVFCIGETGFGTGLNFLLTWQAWRNSSEPRADLHFLSFERHPLALEDLARCLDAWPELAALAAELIAHYPPPLPGRHRVSFDAGRVRLDLCWAEAGEALADMATGERALFDAWYLDGFAPAKNAAMWTPDLLESVAMVSRPGATIATFTAAGHVRRDLSAAGFTVSRVEGFGRKRESIRGSLEGAAPPVRPPALSPWDLQRESPSAPPDHVLVLGAGLAGCHTAAALARRGVRVSVLEQAAVASGASGNGQGILYTRLSKQHAPLGDFALASYVHAHRHYAALFERGALREGIDGALCGSFHQARDGDEPAALAPLVRDIPQVAEILNPGQATARLGIEQHRSGYWFPLSGWLNPPAVCAALLSHDLIELLDGTGAISLQRDGDQWIARSNDEVIAAAPCAVIATGVDARTTPGLEWLPLRSIRGQTTELPSAAPLRELRAAFCHDGYVAPAREGAHTIGATFDIEDPDTALRAGDHGHNVAALGEAVPAWQPVLEEIPLEALGGRVGFRCASPDYLPLVGPVPDRDRFRRTFAPLAANARRIVEQPGDYCPGLYLSTGHGSRGLTSTPLGAELLASMLCGEPLPLERELVRALAPARFLVRELVRGGGAT